MSHAMNTNGKMCIICVDLFNDTNFGALECTYPINPKTKQLLKYKIGFKPPFCKASMITIVRLSTLAPSTTFWRESNMGTFTQFYIIYVCMEIQLPLSIVLTSSHVRAT
jgi:hypothetical protein